METDNIEVIVNNFTIGGSQGQSGFTDINLQPQSTPRLKSNRTF